MDERASRELEKYLRIIGTYENEFSKWQARVKKLVKRYRDDTRGAGGNETAKFNILWSNVQTLVPAVYAKLPQADVQRRFGDNDPVGRVAARLIERAIDFEIEHYPDFRATMKYDVEDRFLGGRGTAWVRYEPHVAPIGIEDDGVSVTSAVEAGEDAPPPLEQIEYERAPVDYVHWMDFGHSQGRTWEEVGQVWRWVYMTREALVERFGEEMARQIPTDQGPEMLNAYRDSKRQYNLSKICELWDKETLKVYWISKGMSHVIDVRDDPLNLEGFYPCPKPLYATMTSDSLVPVPDFVLYQDQAMELDIGLTSRRRYTKLRASATLFVECLPHRRRQRRSKSRVSTLACGYARCKKMWRSLRRMSSGSRRKSCVCGTNRRPSSPTLPLNRCRMLTRRLSRRRWNLSAKSRCVTSASTLPLTASCRLMNRRNGRTGYSLCKPSVASCSRRCRLVKPRRNLSR